jgi:hypothetical protein
MQIDSLLDKPLKTVLGYGGIAIRVVVLAKGPVAVPPTDTADTVPTDVQPDEVLPETEKRPIGGFLEEPKRGRQCCVFLINGQRQHAWDNQFIVRDLELKYLRNRMIVVVDCDGLKPEAVAELMQGSRHQFYEGTVYDALASRLLATLKGDPDLRRLEEEAEEEISSLQAGDEAVKATLDQLIEAHHDAAAHQSHGDSQPGNANHALLLSGSLEQSVDVVVPGDSSVGPLASGPLLYMRPDVATIRVKPNDPRRLLLGPKPEPAWRTVRGFNLTFDPPVKELRVSRTAQSSGEEVTLTFLEPDDFDEDEYPIETLMRATALFKDHPEPRLLERRVVITPRKRRPPVPPVPLKDDPTLVRVTSRQPIKIVIGGPDVHVKMRWDGKDELVTGTTPLWSFRVICESPSVVPLTFPTRPTGGRFEVLIQATPGLKPGEQLKFDVEAVGPGKTLTTAFLADVVEAVTPRKTSSQMSVGAQRRPPYDLRYVTRQEWDDNTCWGERWSPEDPGSFEPPTAKSPLTIFINQDMDLLVAYREALVARKHAETTIKQRINKYTAHVAFHLYQIYEKTKQTTGRTATPEAGADTPSETLMREEIQRVSRTLLRLMDVTS